MRAAHADAEWLRPRALLRAGGYFVSRLFGGSRQPLESVASRSVEISRAQSMRAWPPYFEEPQLPRIQATSAYSAAQIIEEHLHRQVIEFRPLRVHWIEDAWLIDGSVFLAGAPRVELRNTLVRRSLVDRLSLAPQAPCLRLEKAVLAASCAGATWFGHWLEDEVPLLSLAANYGRGVAPRRAEYPHERGYLAAFGLQAPERAGVASVGELTVVEEFAQNPDKTRRYARLRQRLAHGAPGKDRVFLLRGASGSSRPLVNEMALAQRLEREGFHVVDVAATGFERLLQLCRGASVVVGVEGSNLAHALYMMRDGGTLMILNPPWQVHTTVADVGVFCRLHAGMFVCEPAADGRQFVADPDEVLRFLERLLAHGERDRAGLAAYVDEVLALAGDVGRSAGKAGRYAWT